VEEKEIELPLDNEVVQCSTHQHFSAILCLKSIIIICHHNSDFEVKEFELMEDMDTDSKMIASGQWLMIYRQESSILALIDCKKGQINYLPKAVGGKQVFLVQDSLNPDKAIVVHKAGLRGGRRHFLYQMVQRTGYFIGRMGSFLGETKDRSFNFGLYGQYLVVLTSERFKILDTLGQDELKLPNCPVEGGGQALACNEKDLIVVKQEEDSVKVTKVNFLRPYPKCK